MIKFFRDQKNFTQTVLLKFPSHFITYTKNLYGGDCARINHRLSTNKQINKIIMIVIVIKLPKYIYLRKLEISTQANLIVKNIAKINKKIKKKT